MLGTPQQRQEIEAILASKQGSAWALATPERRAMEVDGIINQQQHDAAIQARLSGQMHLPTTSAPAPDASGAEWAGDPREQLKTALEALATAEMQRDDAGEHCDRALKRIAACEESIAEYGDLDASVDAWTIKQVRAGKSEELPFGLLSATKERAAAAEKLQQAGRAHKRLAGELKDAERRVQERQREVGIWAERVIVQEKGEQLAADLERLTTERDEKLAQLAALPSCFFPGAGGACRVSPAILKALSLTTLTREQLTPMDLEPHRQAWQAKHAALLADPEA